MFKTLKKFSPLLEEDYFFTEKGTNFLKTFKKCNPLTNFFRERSSESLVTKSLSFSLFNFEGKVN